MDRETGREGCSEQTLTYTQFLSVVAQKDVDGLFAKDREYGASWKKRGGVGAFMMLARKWDRLELAVAAHGWDIFQLVEADRREEGAIDDVRDLRRYLLLVEAELMRRAQCRPAVPSGR